MEDYVGATLDYASWKKYIVVSQCVGEYSVRTKRHIFQCIRNHEEVDENCVLADYGVTCGEFALFSTVGGKSSANFCTAG